MGPTLHSNASVPARRVDRRFAGAWLDGVVVAVLIAVVGISFGRALTIRPFDADNLIGLSIAADDDLGSLFTGSFISYLPGFRPVGYLTLWAEYRVHGLVIWPYYLVNLVIWALCAAGLYALLVRVTGLRLPAAAAAILFAVDERAAATGFWITERQSSLACLFGIAALAIVAYQRDPPRRVALGLVFAFLLAAALSKEFGLAFALAVLVLGILRGRRGVALALASMLAAATYGALRLVLAGGAVASFCEDVGWLSTTRHVCYAELPLGERVQQEGYNVAATLVGTVYPSLFSASGAWAPTVGKGLLFSLGIALLATLGAFRRPREAAPFLAVIVGNALLSFLIYRTRNHVVGMVGLYGLAGLGIAAGLQLQVMRRHRRALVAALAVALVGAAVWSAVTTARYMAERRDTYSSTNPCESLANYPDDIDRTVVERLRRRFGRADTPCE